MDKIQAHKFIQEVFTQAFDRERFRRFVKELLNHFDPAEHPPMLVPDAFTEHIRSCQRLGTYKAPDGELLDILIVNVAQDYKIERTRTALRDFVAHKLKRGDNYKEAGLVAFVPPSADNWRFSFVKMEYETVRDQKTGKIKPEERLTPARRYSYLVGVNERSHTAQKQLVPLLADDRQDPELSAIEQAFSVEKVTKEFFTEYARLFEITTSALDGLVKQDKVLRTDFETKHVKTIDFAKKLLGQIVFLYFIQKKGWLGVPKNGKWGDGPRDFFRQLANQAIEKKQSLFNDVLEPLFYNTLADDRGHEAWCKTFQCRIPFLNGGLFEPLAGYDWENTEIHLPNSLFTNNERSPQGDIGIGILDVFDRYNFTVNEAEPLEKEVAIDPEMLGKVFENLIEENRRKGLGAFYTPREIVHYMCQESLINYLDTALNKEKGIIERADIEKLIREGEQAAHYETARKDGTISYVRRLPEAVERNARALDDALKAITVCDPAIGSGAFPVGMMTEVVRARAALTPYFNDIAERTVYHFKRHAIQNSLYGVDIDPGAVEIAKLRLWLSLVVDEEDVQQIKPLPNLDYKIVVGNSLLGVEKNLFNYEKFKQLEELKPKFFDETDRKKKAQFKKQIEALIHDLTNGREIFDFEIYFSEVFHAKGGFDMVIGNPPYVRIQELKKANAKIADLLKKNYVSARKGNYDLYVVFVEKGLQLLNGGGYFAFILPHKFFNAQYGEPLRELISRGKHLHHVVHFGDQQIFAGATNYVCLLFLAKAGAEQCRWMRADNLPMWLQTFRAPEAELPSVRVTASEWNFMVGKGSDLFDRLQRMPVKLGNVARIFQGLVTGADSVFVLKNVGKGKFYSKATDQEHEIENKLMHPLCKGALDIRRFCVEELTKSILFPYQITKNKAKLILASDFKENYPKAWDYLLACKKQLEAREGGKWKHNQWYALGRSQNLGEMEQPKILTPSIAAQASFTLDRTNFYYFLGSGGGGGGGYGITVRDGNGVSLEFLLALLNSRLLDYFLHQISSSFRGGYCAYNRQFIERLPIIVPSELNQKPVVRLVDHILLKKQQEPKTNTSTLEQEINQLVYRLYDLTKEEIEIVEERIISG